MGSPAADPASWDTEDLVRVLCASNRAWATDPLILANNIREHELNGAILLETGNFFSFDQLFNDLGIRGYSHRFALGKFIHGLRDGTAPPLAEATKRKQTAEPESTNDAVAPDQHASKRKRLDMSMLSVVQPSGTLPTNIPTAADAVAHWTALQQDATPKTQQSQNSFALVIDSALGEYYGRGFLKTLAIISPRESLSNRLMLGDENNFRLVGRNTTPIGLQRAVACVHRRFLRNNSRRELRINSGIASTAGSDGDEILSLSDLADEVDEQTWREMEEEIEEVKAMRTKDVALDRIKAVLGECIEEMEKQWNEKKLPRCAQKNIKLLKQAHRANNRKGASFKEIKHVKYLDNRITKLCEEIQGQKWSSEDQIRFQARLLEQSVEERMNSRWLITALRARDLPNLPAKPRQARAKKKPPVNFQEEILESTDDEIDFVVPDDEATPKDLVSSFGSLSPTQLDHVDMVDLTQLSPIKNKPVLVELKTPTKVNKDGVIDLTSPLRPPDSPPQFLSTHDAEEADGDSVNRAKQNNLLSKMPSIENIDDVREIARLLPSEWQHRGDRFKMLVSLLWRYTHERQRRVLDAIAGLSDRDVWPKLVQPYLDQPLGSVLDVAQGGEKVVQLDVSRCLYAFSNSSPIGEARMTPLKQNTKASFSQIATHVVTAYCRFIRYIAPAFPKANQIHRIDDVEESSDSTEAASMDGDAVNDKEKTKSAKKRKAREVILNQKAVNMREREVQRKEALEKKKQRLEEELVTAESHGTQRVDKPIVNAAKEDGQALIYINDDRINKRLKPHQVQGVQFLWEQIVRPPDVRQGALLAHTMGLGKTMQVITFLIVLAEAAANPETQDQIPVDLRDSRTLIICPSALVNNWEDEILKWLPRDANKLLGCVTKFDSSVSSIQRLQCVKEWSKSAGIMLMGDGMIRCGQESGENHEIQQILLRSATVIVLDEAHSIKNPASQLSQLCIQFDTKTRIALTGSPLSNHVEEYYSIIDWIAPGFLGPIDEFKQVYVSPFNRGFENDSTWPDKRNALKALRLLKQTISPKVDRRTIDDLRGLVPPKYEFVLSLAPTISQETLYNRYIQESSDEVESPTGFFEKLSDLGLICNHPSCFYEKIEIANKNASAKPWHKTILADRLEDEGLGYKKLSPGLSNKVRLLDMILEEARKNKDKVLVFSQSIPTLNYLSNHFTKIGRKFCRLEGSTKTSQRVSNVKDFNEGSQDVYLIATKAGGVGLNIHGANRVVIFDSSLNPTHEQQAVGRSYRLGQTKPVFVYYLLIAGSFEAGKQQRSVFKMQLASRVVDKKNPIAWAKRRPELIHPIRQTEQEDLSKLKGKDTVLDHIISSNYKHMVRSIIPTNAFEEEDLDAYLTKEETMDIDRKAVALQQRTSNPAEYERVKRQSASATVSPTQSGDRQPAGHLQNGHSTQYTGGPSKAQTPTAGQVPAPLLVGSTHSSAWRPATTSQPATMTPGLASTAPSSDPLYLSPLRPVPGTNTYFSPEANASDRPTWPPSFGPSIIAQHQSSQPPRGSQGTTSSIFTQPQSADKMSFVESFTVAIRELQHRGQFSPAVEPTQLAASIANGIDGELKALGRGFLQDGRRFRELTELLENERFPWAVASSKGGGFTPQYLARAPMREVLSRLAILNDLSEEDFRLQHRRRDLDSQGFEVLQDGANDLSRVRPDQAAVSQTNERGGHQLHRLPPWGYEGLAREAQRHDEWPRSNFRQPF